MTATLLNPHPVSENFPDLFATRSYDGLLKKGQQILNFLKQYESDPETLEQIRREFANTFWDSCLAIATLDPTLEAQERERLSNLKFRFTPAEVAQTAPSASGKMPCSIRAH